MSAPFRKALERFVEWRWSALLVVAAGALLHLPSLGMGFYADDYIHQLVLERRFDVPHLTPWSLYDFGPIEDWVGLEGSLGSVPWWTEPDWSVRFFRPLASLSLWLDHALHGSKAAGYHATSLLVYAAALAVAHALYRALGLGRGAALGALALFAATNGAALCVAWPAHRNSLLAALFLLSALLAVATPSRAASRRWILLALLLASAAVLCKESGAIAFVLLALRLARRAQGTGDPASRRAFAGALAALALCVLWLTLLWAAGYGTNSLFYATPWREPLRYLARLGVLLPVGLLRLVAPVPLDFLTLHPGLALPLALASAAIVIPLARLVARRLRAFPTASFLAIWLALGLLAQGAAPASDRLLLDAAFGSAGLLALFIGAALSRAARAPTSRAERSVARALLVTAGVLCALFTLAQSSSLATMARSVRASVLATEVGPPALGRRDVLVLQSGDALVPFSLAATWAVESQDHDLRFWILQMGRRGLEWERDGERSFVLRSLDEPFLTHVFERLYRTRSAPPPTGTVYETGLFCVTALDSGPGGLCAIRVTLERSLDEPTLLFVADRAGTLAALPVPPIGAQKIIPAAPRSHALAL